MPDFDLIQNWLDLLLWRRGGRRDFWYANVDTVGNFIKENSLKPIEARQMPIGGPAFASGSELEMRSTEAARLWPGGLAGGIRFPHLHYAGQFYVLNERQWADFTKKVMSSVSEKLNKSQKVSFDQLMDVADAAQAM
jgi:hypothetical protein